MRPLGRSPASQVKLRFPRDCTYAKEVRRHGRQQFEGGMDVSAPSRTICSRWADGLAMASSTEEMPPSPSPVGSPNRQFVSPESESMEIGIPSSASGVRLGVGFATFRSQQRRCRIRENTASDRLVAIDATVRTTQVRKQSGVRLVRAATTDCTARNNCDRAARPANRVGTKKPSGV